MIFDSKSGKFLLIAGPCSLESRDLSFQVAEEVARIADKYSDFLTVLFKGSFDKANRTSIKSPRGPGLEEGLKILAAVKVKKGQFLSPYDMKYVVAKLREAGASEIWQAERGSTFGYGNLVVDMRAISIMAENGTPVIIDATHSVQLPGCGDGVSGGDRKYVELIAKAAVAAGADGMFIETHPTFL